MPYESVFVGAVLLSGGFAVLVAAWLHSEDLGLEAKVFTAFVLLHPVAAVTIAAELLVPPGSGLATALYGIQHAVVVPVVPLWFAFAALYTGRRHWLSRPVVAVIGAWAVATMLLQATNPLHGLVWTGYEVAASPFPYTEGLARPYFGFLTLPQPLLNLLAMGLLAHRFLFGSGIKRPQTIALFVGFLPPWLVFGAWGAGVLPGPLNGWFVVGSTWSFVLVAWAVYRYQLFDLVPLARETVFEELGDPVVVVDSDGRLIDANGAAYAEFPVLDGGGGEPLADLLPPLANPDGEDLFATGFTHITEGGPREFAVTVSTISDAGEERGYGLVVRDVSEREQHVRDLERQTEQLERFASTLSHDLRNPLNVAQARVRMAIERGSTEDLESADDALERSNAMIQDLLSLAREGRTVDETERVRLADVFRDAWETTDTRGATYEVSRDADVVVYADASRLRSVFENLIRNAIQHGGRDVAVTLGHSPGGFYVEDDGPGVPPDERETVFEFDYTTHEDGTGLGLATVDAIAGAHGWTVEMAEGTDGGARVVFSDVDVVDDAAGRRESVLAA